MSTDSDLLRVAARVMRKRAEAATLGLWHSDGAVATEEDATHIASWSPRVALAVAAWLEAKAEQDDKGHCDAEPGPCNHCEHDYGNVAALEVAREYLWSEYLGRQP